VDGAPEAGARRPPFRIRVPRRSIITLAETEHALGEEAVPAALVVGERRVGEVPRRCGAAVGQRQHRRRAAARRDRRTGIAVVVGEGGGRLGAGAGDPHGDRSRRDRAGLDAR
jgi:hypothetical protein